MAEHQAPLLREPALDLESGRPSSLGDQGPVSSSSWLGGWFGWLSGQPDESRGDPSPMPRSFQHTADQYSPEPSGMKALRRLRTGVDDIQHDETKRIMYLPDDTFMPVFAWAKTQWPAVIRRKELHVANFLYVLIVGLRFAFPSFDFTLLFKGTVSTFIGFLSSTMVFFLTFYNNQVYQRYIEEWKCTQTAYGRINDLNLVVPAYMDSTPIMRDTIMRLVNAYHHIVYLTGAGLKDARIVNSCVKRKVLTEEEGKQLLSQDCSAQMRVLIWATQEVARSDISDIAKYQINEYIVQLRRNLAYLWSYDDQPVPYIYLHTMNTLVVMVVWLQSLCNACTLDLLNTPENSDLEFWVVFIWSFLMQLLYSMVVLLLRELTIGLFDPLGSAEIPAERYMNLHLEGCSKLSKYNSVPRDSSGDAGNEFSHAHSDVHVRDQPSDSADRRGRRHAYLDIFSRNKF